MSRTANRLIDPDSITAPGLHHDGNGLYLQIRGVSRVWIYRFTLNERTRDMGLGSARAVSIEEARAQRDLFQRSYVRMGLDPIDMRKRRTVSQFNANFVQELQIPPGKMELLVFDRSLPGFGVRIRAGGKRTWIVQYRVAGRTRRETLGDIRCISVETARLAALRRFAHALLVKTAGPVFDPQTEPTATTPPLPVVKKASKKIRMEAAYRVLTELGIQL